MWLLFAGTAWGQPVVGVAASDWQLEFDFHDPQRIEVQLPGEAKPTIFWYVLYTVTNETGRDVEFYPSFALVTDSLQTVDAGSDIPPRVFDEVKARHVKEFPFIAAQRDVTGPLLQGDGNARTSVAIFRNFDPEANAFTIYASGAAGRVERVTNPAFDASRDESESNPRFFTLRRTLAVSYKLPGDPKTRVLATPVRTKREWVMR